MNDTTNLQLPYISPAQAQKHVTHNEALTKLDALVQLSVLSADLLEPPTSSEEGDRYLIAENATGEWNGRDGQIAAFQGGAWAYFAPQEGWVCWVTDASKQLIRSSDIWLPMPVSVNLDQLSGIGIQSDHDAVNRLSINADASLFSNEGAGHQIKVNRAASVDTASLLFQTGFAGNAEMGVLGGDVFRIKTSADNVTFNDAIIANPDASVLMPNTQHVCGVYHASMDEPFQTSSTSYIPLVDLGITVLPKSAQSRFLVMLSIAGYAEDSYSGYVRITRNGTEIFSGDPSSYATGSGTFVDLISQLQWGTRSVSNFGVDAPATGSAVTYQVEVRTGHSTKPVYVNSNHKNLSQTGWLAVPSSNLIVVEIAK